MATTPTDSATFEIRPFPGIGDPAYLLPRITADVSPYWEALKQGHVELQACRGCGKVRHPVMPVCPYCLNEEYDWQPVAGSGTVFAWIRYHKGYLPEFEPLMPYCVLTVQLEAGPRMFGRFGGDADPEIGMRVKAIGERWPGGEVVPAFVPQAR